LNPSPASRSSPEKGCFNLLIDNPRQTPGEASKTGDKLLIIAADPRGRDALAVVLQSENYRLLFARDEESALRIAREDAPVLILYDFDETLVSGADRFFDVLRSDRRVAHTPIIFLSAMADTADRIRVLTAGAIDYIAKPYERSELLARVRGQCRLARMAVELINTNERLVEKQAILDAELRDAARLQKATLPARPAESFDRVSLAWRFISCDLVGGDLCNFHWFDEDHLIAYVADVSGHGVPAAMLTLAISRSLASGGVRPGPRRPDTDPAMLAPGEVLRRLDREYPIERFDKFFTVAYCVLDRRNGAFRYSLAGHPRPILSRADGRLETLDCGGTIIGLADTVPFEEGVGMLSPGDSVLLYSDGLTECQNEAGESFGEDRLRHALGASAGAAPGRICDAVTRAVRRFRGAAPTRDDITMLALRYES